MARKMSPAIARERQGSGVTGLRPDRSLHEGRDDRSRDTGQQRRDSPGDQEDLRQGRRGTKEKGHQDDRCGHQECCPHRNPAILEVHRMWSRCPGSLSGKMLKRRQFQGQADGARHPRIQTPVRLWMPVAVLPRGSHQG